MGFASGKSLLRVTGLRKSYGDKAVLKGIDLEVRSGEVVFIIGPSGSGKSTFLRSLNFLSAPSAGQIVFDGQVLCDGAEADFHAQGGRKMNRIRASMPMVFQHFNLFKHKTILENVIEGPLVVQMRPRAEVVREARAILEQIGMCDKCDAYPAQLSGGQQQRAAIARAMAMHPQMILFDEPTSALDPELVTGVLETIRTLADAGMTMIVVTHEMAFARRLADTVYFMADGRIVEAGPPTQLFEQPRTDRLKAFLQLAPG
jgi:ABC-type polar amino acid transport system ATPase subunit